MKRLRPSARSCWARITPTPHKAYQEREIAAHTRFLRLFSQLLAAGQEAPLRDISLLEAAERHKLLEEWNQTDPLAYPHGETIHNLFEAQVEIIKVTPSLNN